MASETNLGSGNLSLTRYGGIAKTLQTPSGTQIFDAQQLYAMAAWLTTQFALNSSATDAIQDTLWGLFNSNSHNGGLDHPQYAGNQPPISNAWLFAAENNYASLNLSTFTILTDTSATHSGQGQELIFHTAVAQTPEPASMGLLGAGLMLLSIVGRRTLSPKGSLATASNSQSPSILGSKA
jgi:hypothetical protein